MDMDATIGIPTFTGENMAGEGEQVSDVKKAGFWISQLMVIIATVGGVYFAASQGLKQAIQFDSIKSDQTNYYLRKSLQSELSDNAGYIRDYTDKVSKRVVKPSLNLESFVWKSMMYSPNALETPSDLLREAQKFYHTANEIMTNPHFNDSNRAKSLGELADHIESKVLPLFTKDLDALRDKLGKRGITL